MTKILIDEAVVRQVLEALLSAPLDRSSIESRFFERRHHAITALRQALADAALDKMSENARELGLSYEQPAPAQQLPPNCGTGYCSCIECLFEKSGIGITKGGA